LGGRVGFEVQIDRLRAAAVAGRSVAELVGSVRPGDDLVAGAAGVPGSSAVSLMEQVAARWEIAVTQWWDRARWQARSLEVAADTYAEAEQATEQAVNAVAGVLGVSQSSPVPGMEAQ
jgi:hypothetical protein